MLGVRRSPMPEISRPARRRDIADALDRADQDRLDQAQPRGLDGALQRDIVAGMRDGHLDRRLRLRRLDQASILLVRPCAAFGGRQACAASALSSLRRLGHRTAPRPAPGDACPRPTAHRAPRGPDAGHRAPPCAAASSSPSSFGSASTARSSSRRTSRYCSRSISLNRARLIRFAGRTRRTDQLQHREAALVDAAFGHADIDQARAARPPSRPPNLEAAFQFGTQPGIAAPRGPGRARRGEARPAARPSPTSACSSGEP